MKGRADYTRSSMITAWPVLGLDLVLGVLSAVRGARALSALLLFFFVLGALARLWATGAAKRLSLRVRADKTGLFPGETLTLEAEIVNDKLLPVLWTELFMPLGENLCLLPEERRAPLDWEKTSLRELGASEELVGEKKLGYFGWYEHRTAALRFSAERRGVYSLQTWRLRTGDGFGFLQIEHRLPDADGIELAVYPRLTEAEADIFLRNLWNADTGAHGVTPDPTVIRSTRDYTDADSARHINWRLRARGLPLSVNVYDDILPQSVHFLLDGESFAAHAAELEEALSLLASVLVLLGERQIPCGLSICAGKRNAPVDLPAPLDTETALRALARYDLLPVQLDAENGAPLRNASRFDAEAILRAAQSAGRFYYIAWDSAAFLRQEALLPLGAEALSVLSWEGGSCGEYEVLSLPALRKEGEYA